MEKQTRIATAIVHGAAANVADALVHQIERDLGGAPEVALVFASGEQPLAELMSALKARLPLTVLLGAMTADELDAAAHSERTVSLVAIAGELRVHAALACGLKRGKGRVVGHALEALPPPVPGYPQRTALLLIDGREGGGEDIMLAAALMLGEGVPIIDSAAGDERTMRHTRVALDGDVADDALVLALIDSKAPLVLDPPSDGALATRWPLRRSDRPRTGRPGA
jgi:methyl-accepting chemotaxis protein